VSGFWVVMVMTATSIAAGLVMISRARGLSQLGVRQQRRSRDQELHWTAIRLRSEGRQGHELQELLCSETNCTPGEADLAIFRVGANT